MESKRIAGRDDGTRSFGPAARRHGVDSAPDATSSDATTTSAANCSGIVSRDRSKDYAELWEQFWTTGSATARNELVERYLHLVDEVVRRVPSGVAAHWSVDDLKSYGTFGLINAVDLRQRELARIPFAVYARRRIQGAIYDELRKLDWLPRTARRRTIEFNLTEDDLRVDLRRSPNRAEILAAMDITDLRRTAATVSALQRSQIASLDGPIRGEEEGSLLDSLSESADTESDMITRLDHDALRSALDTLPERQRSVITMRFVQQLSLRETGERVGISESRARQVEIDALRGLRHALSAQHAA